MCVANVHMLQALLFCLRALEDREPGTVAAASLSPAHTVLCVTAVCRVEGVRRVENFLETAESLNVSGCEIDETRDF